MGAASSSEDFQLEPRRLDRAFESVHQTKPRVPLGTIHANKRDSLPHRPGLVAKKRAEPPPPCAATIVPPTPANRLDACCDLATLLTPGATRSALKDEACRRHALNAEGCHGIIAQSVAGIGAQVASRSGIACAGGG